EPACFVCRAQYACGGLRIERRGAFGQHDCAVVVARRRADASGLGVELVLDARLRRGEPLAVDGAGQPNPRLCPLATTSAPDVERDEELGITHAAFRKHDRAMP